MELSFHFSKLFGLSLVSWFLFPYFVSVFRLALCSNVEDPMQCGPQWNYKLSPEAFISVSFLGYPWFSCLIFHVNAFHYCVFLL